MEKYYALIKNNIVESIIVANEDFLPHIQDKYDVILDVTDNRPVVGQSYYPDTSTFIENKSGAVHIDTDLEAEHLKLGTEDGFEPFKLSKYSVKYENGMVHIGCRQYSAPGLLDALHRGLVEKQTGTVSCFVTEDAGPMHGKFGITWNDAQLLYNALIKVRF